MSQSNLMFSLAQHGYFQSMQYNLGFKWLKWVKWYLKTHPNNPIIFTKKLGDMHIIRSI